MSKVTLRQVSKNYGATTALEVTDLVAENGEFLTLLGPSGCGKTTTLRIIAGFTAPTSGSLHFDADEVTRVPPNKRNIGMVFQDYALFPHLSIEENIAFSLRERGYKERAIRTRVTELLELIQLPAIGRRLPSEISGGQQQRVAFARAVAHPPRVLLMDEPLGALDLKMRETMQMELKRLQRSLAITTVYVTHDQTEAMNLSDRIAVMNKGRISQLGTPRDIYDRPNSRFVAEFVGQINLLGIRLESDGPRQSAFCSDGTELQVPTTAQSTSRDPLLAVRPQNVQIVNGSAVPEDHNRLKGRVASRSFVGNLVQTRIDLKDSTWSVESRPGEYDFAEGAEVSIHWHPSQSLVLENALA